MWDGQNIFHEFDSWGGKINRGWQVDETLDSLNKEDNFTKMIIVGIYNSNSRMADYMPEKPYELVKERIRNNTNEWYESFRTDPPKSDDQLKFLVSELKPFIDQNFKTKRDRENTFIAGASMGGLLSAYAICEYPDVFGGAACLSTHWPPLEGVFLEYLKDNLPDPKDHKIYFDHGTETLDSMYLPFQIVADSIMKVNGYEVGKNWMTKVYQGDNHHEDSWRKRFDIPLKFIVE
jgi:enterochelin esterase-like enzyme